MEVHSRSVLGLKRSMLKVLLVERNGWETLKPTRTMISAAQDTAHFVRGDCTKVQIMPISYQNQAHDRGETRDSTSVNS